MALITPRALTDRPKLPVINQMAIEILETQRLTQRSRNKNSIYSIENYDQQKEGSFYMSEDKKLELVKSELKAKYSKAIQKKLSKKKIT